MVWGSALQQGKPLASNTHSHLCVSFSSPPADTVVAVGSGVTKLKPGDRVWADIGANAMYKPDAESEPVKTKELGGWAEYALGLETQVGLMPSNICLREAGSLPKVALTSYKALSWHCGSVDWASAPTVLIIGGSSGCGWRGRSRMGRRSTKQSSRPTSKQHPNLPARALVHRRRPLMLARAHRSCRATTTQLLSRPDATRTPVPSKGSGRQECVQRRRKKTGVRLRARARQHSSPLPRAPAPSARPSVRSLCLIVSLRAA